MKILPHLIIILFFLCSTVSAQTPSPPCQSCPCLLEKADELAKDIANMEAALQKYNAVKVCAPELAEEVDERILDLFQRIRKLKNDAEWNA